MAFLSPNQQHQNTETWHHDSTDQHYSITERQRGNSPNEDMKKFGLSQENAHDRKKNARGNWHNPGLLEDRR